MTDSVIDEVTAWQARPIEPTYAIVFFDALGVKIATKGWCATTRSSWRIGMCPSGHKDVLGL